MSNYRHQLLLVCIHAFALSCASRQELPRAPAISPLAQRSIVAELGSTPPSTIAAAVTNPYAPTRSLGAATYSWQSEKRAECPAESSAREQPGVLAAFPERTPEAGINDRAVSADSVVLGLRPAIHHCFSRWLEAKLDAQGSVRFALELGCAGEVQAISAENQGVDEGTLECLFAVVAPARFAPPVGGRATILVPVVLKNAAR